MEERQSVLDRMLELEGWAEYITEALHLNQASEPVKREMLERTVEGRSLREIRELSFRLRDKLHVARIQVELSRPLEKSAP